MRFLVLALLTTALAWGVWSLLGDEDPSRPARTTPPEERGEPRVPDHSRGTPRVVPTSGTISIRVRDRSGGIPTNAEAGYRTSSGVRMRAVDEQGVVLFTDAPLGRITVLARASGYAEVEQETYLNGGVPGAAVLVLTKPAKEDGG